MPDNAGYPASSLFRTFYPYPQICYDIVFSHITACLLIYYKKEFRSAKFCAANASLSSDIFICVCVCILAERFCIIGKFGGLSYDTKTFTNAKVFWIRFANFSRVDVFPVRRIADAVPAGLNDFLSI